MRSWGMLVPQMLVGSLPDLLSLRLSSSMAGDGSCTRPGWFLDFLPRAAAIWIHPHIPGQGGSSDLCLWLTFGGESRHMGQSLHGMCSLSPMAIRTPRTRLSQLFLTASPAPTWAITVGSAARTSTVSYQQTDPDTSLALPLPPHTLAGMRWGPPGCLPSGFALIPIHQHPETDPFVPLSTSSLHHPRSFSCVLGGPWTPSPGCPPSPVPPLLLLSG